jgi:hypothetical protein
MTKLLVIALCAAALGACSNMSGTRSMGNTSDAGNSSNKSETKNSTDANRSNNPAAVSPGGGGAGASR